MVTERTEEKIGEVPKSMAQMPVPVAISRTFWGLGAIGARWSFSSSCMDHILCCMSVEELLAFLK